MSVKKIIFFFLILTLTFRSQNFNYNFYKHLEFIASDSTEGRFPGTKGSKIAANYIVKNLKEIKTLPFWDSSYFQSIPLVSLSPKSETNLIVKNDFLEKSLVLNQDYVLLHYSLEAIIANYSDLVFVGYGISSYENDYDDYLGIDVIDKVAVFLSGSPNNVFFTNNQLTYDDINYKIKNAMAHGAKGCILIPNPKKISKDFWKYRLFQYQFDKIILAYSLSENFAIMLNPEKANILFEGSPYSFEEVLNKEERNNLSSFKLMSKISFKPKFKENFFLGQNIGGIVKSKKKSDKYIIIGAHYDGFGIGPPMSGDSIYNGAFDNASGVAMTLEIARYFSINPLNEVNLGFIFFDGEEQGLLGSTFFCDNISIPLNKILAMVNIDAAALFEETNSFFCVGLEEIEEVDIFFNALKKMNLNYAEYMKKIMDGRYFSLSDHFSFQNFGIPSFMIIEGFDYKYSSVEEGAQRYFEWILEKYHSPFDDLNQEINLDAANQYYNVAINFINEIASKKIINFKKDSQFYSKQRKNSLIKK